MADLVFQLFDKSTSPPTVAPLKLVDNGDGTYSLGTSSAGGGGDPITIAGPLGRRSDATSASVALSTEDAALLSSMVASLSIALTAVDFTIASGASLSGAIDLASLGVTRIVMPAAWTAANLTFQTSQDGVTYQDLYDAFGSEYTVIAAAAHNLIMTPSDLVGLRYLKIRSGTSGTPVNQGAARTITLITRAF